MEVLEYYLFLKILLLESAWIVLLVLGFDIFTLKTDGKSQNQFYSTSIYYEEKIWNLWNTILILKNNEITICKLVLFLVLDWHSSSLDESWDSRLPTPLALDFSAEEEDFAPYTNGGSEDLYINNGYTGWFLTPFVYNAYKIIIHFWETTHLPLP